MASSKVRAKELAGNRMSVKKRGVKNRAFPRKRRGFDELLCCTVIIIYFVRYWVKPAFSFVDEGILSADP